MSVELVRTPTKLYRIIDTDHSRVGRWMFAHDGGYYREGATCIGLTRKGDLVAGVMYDFYNGAAIFASIVIRGPITRRWLNYIFAYPFVQLQCKVIIGLISSANEKSIRLVDHMGFVKTAEIPGADKSGVLLLYSMSRESCRFIRSPYL